VGRAGHAPARAERCASCAPRTTRSPACCPTHSERSTCASTTTGSAPAFLAWPSPLVGRAGHAPARSRVSDPAERQGPPQPGGTQRLSAPSRAPSHLLKADNDSKRRTCCLPPAHRWSCLYWGKPLSVEDHLASSHQAAGRSGLGRARPRLHHRHAKQLPGCCYARAGARLQRWRGAGWIEAPACTHVDRRQVLPWLRLLRRDKRPCQSEEGKVALAIARHLK